MARCEDCLHFEVCQALEQGNGIMRVHPLHCGFYKPTSDVAPRAEWISVEKMLPDVCGMPVLMVAENEYGQTNVVKGFTNYTCPNFFSTNEMEYYSIWHAWKVTHWMPMPDPPKGD